MKFNNIEFTLVDLGETNSQIDVKPKIRINKQAVIFNRAACVALSYPKYIEMYVNTERKAILFVGINKQTETSRNFAIKHKDGKGNGYVSLSAKRFVKLMKSICNVETGQIVGTSDENKLLFYLDDIQSI